MLGTLNGSTATLTYTDVGKGEAMLIFLHYWGGSGRTWAPVIARLEPYARCVALNLRGWGDSVALDGRYDLDAMAEDVATLISTLKPEKFVLVGHSMGGKVAQMVAKQNSPGLHGVVLVAPAPPTPITVPAAQRDAMLDSYQTREGVMQALSVLTASPLPAALREQVIADTLAGHAQAKRAWTDAGMLEDVSAGLDTVSVPVQVVVGDRDQVERADDLRASLMPVLPQARFSILTGVGHLSPLENPDAVADTCAAMLRPGRGDPG